MFILVATISFLCAAWLFVNLVHAVWVETRRHLWERRITRQPNGLLPEADAYQVGNGPIALLFIHGFADTPCLWRRITRRLAANGAFTCRAMRLPGSAEPAARSKLQSLEIWRAHVDDELARLHEAHKTVWVIGHSLGGTLALDAALRHPVLVDGVAALAPVFEISRQCLPLFPPPVWFSIARIALCLSPTLESPFSDDNVAADDPLFVHKRDRFIPFRAYCAVVDLTRAIRNQSTRPACPLFAVESEQDPIVDGPAALRWMDACTGPKEVIKLTNAGHLIPLEKGWQEGTDAFAAFVLSHTPAVSASAIDAAGQPHPRRS